MVDKRPLGAIVGKSDYLEKKIPKNPKYSNVGPTVKTGLHAQHIEVVSDQKISKRKGEFFRRIKPSTLSTLLARDNNQESIYNLAGENDPYGHDQSDTQSMYSAYTAQSGYTEASKMSAITSATEQLALADNSEFLLLDLREAEDFEKFHIKESLNFPAPNLGRDKFLPEIYKFKNKENKLIIMYHLDERTSIPYVNQMCQKGYDNVYLLTGGIEAFVEKCPHHVEGKELPTNVKQADKKNKVLYKRSKHVGEPEQGDVIIPSTHIEDDSRSVLSTSTRTSQIGNASKTGSKMTTQTTLNKNASRVSPTTKIFKI